MPKVSRRGNAKLAVAYVRVSTDTDRQALGAEAQRQAIERWAEGTGTTICEWFVEEVSGGAPLDKRPLLLQAIATVATLGAGSLVVQRLDRYSRDPLTAALAEAELRKHGASLVCADGAGSGDSPTDELIRGILLAVARFEKALIRSRIKAALAVKRSRGERIGAAPYGTKAEGKSLAIHSEEVATIRRLRELRSLGLTLRALIDQATAEGIRNRAGKPFTLAAVHKLVNRMTALPIH
jgi:DNA invertase Pin-like site-specific DNA recombinase